MSEEIKETLDDIKRHLDYVEATKQSSIRDNEIKIMYDYITSLQQKVEQLEKELQITANKCKQLENIRKEAIKYVQEKADYPISYYHCLNDLLNILNKGDNKE